ncbi:MAG: ATP-binding protein [Okeania sp. SIO3C4]|nr:ATP-binding protein [Okeania sp. SIO3C4]
MPNNPFFPAGPVPPEYFIGRKSELRFVFDLISKNLHGAFYGSPGMGKSSLLYLLTYPEIWQQQGQDYSKSLIVYLNCTDINPFTPYAFWQEVLILLKDEVEDNDELKAVIDEVLEGDTIEKTDIRQILRKIGKQDKDKFLLLLIDDYDSALKTNTEYTEVEMLTFLSEFRNLAVDPKLGRHLRTIVTTFRRLNELGPTLPLSGSPWYNHYIFQPIKPFSKAEVLEEFFTSTSPRFIRIKQSLQEGVLKITDGHPELLQNAGYLLYEGLQEGKIPDIETFIKDFQGRTEQIFDNIWQFSTDEEQILLILIALSRLEGNLGKKSFALKGIDNIFSQKERELIDLEERGIIKKTAEDWKTVYEFTSSMMEWWVLREIENSDETELKKREKVFLRLMSREQVEGVTQVFKQVWKYRKVVQSFVNIISRFLGNPT